MKVFELAIEAVKRYFAQDTLGSYEAARGVYLEELAYCFVLMRLAGEELGAVKEQVIAIAKQHAASVPVPDQEKCWHLLRIAQHFAALGELLGADLLQLVKPLLVEGLREFAAVRPIYYILGPNFPERSSDLRETALRMYCNVSHFVQIDISSAFPGWRTAVVQHLEQGKKDRDTRDEEGLLLWQREFQEEMAIIDAAIADYKPLPNSKPL